MGNNIESHAVLNKVAEEIVRGFPRPKPEFVVIHGSIQEDCSYVAERLKIIGHCDVIVTRDSANNGEHYSVNIDYLIEQEKEKIS